MTKRKKKMNKADNQQVYNDWLKGKGEDFEYFKKKKKKKK